jgi:NADH dehydrogenase
MFRMPVWFHYALGWLLERIMTVPMVSVAQVRILSEGLTEPKPNCDQMPSELAPQIRFSEFQIRKGLPAPGPFGLRDIRFLSKKVNSSPRLRIWRSCCAIRGKET